MGNTPRERVITPGQTLRERVMTRVYVGIGSNLGDSAGLVREAFGRLRGLGSNFVNSDLYLTRPWGVTDQPDFINAVAGFDAEIEARPLLRRLGEIEAEFGRRLEERWGPRTLDLDLLLCGDRTIDEPDVAIPHPRMRERAFVLAPLMEIARGLRVPPDGTPIEALYDALSSNDRASVRRLVGTASPQMPPRVDYDAPDGAGEQYDDLRPFSKFDVAVLNAVLEIAGPLFGKRVLDVGCGTGRFSDRLAAAGASVVGFDSSSTMLAAARTRSHAGNGAVDYVVGDANLSLPHGPFDAITAFYCVQYIDVAALARLARIELSDGGTIAVASFPHRHFAEIEFSRFFPSLPAIDMARFPSALAIENAIKKAGFADVETRDVSLTIEDDPVALIGRVERKYLSSFFLLPAPEFRHGIEMMRREWQSQAVVRRSARAVVVSGRVQPGVE